MTQHQTARRANTDGTYSTECTCGWVSEPAGHRDELGWVCPRHEAELGMLAVVRDLADVYTLDTDQAAVIRLVQRAKAALTAVGRAS